MSFKLVPRGWETSSTTGTGALTLAGAVTNYPNTGDTWRAFSADLSNGDTTYYAAVNRSVQTEWEEGIGTWGTGGILTRTTIIRSSNSNNAVNFTGPVLDVMCTPITRAAVPGDLTAGRVVLVGTGGVITDNAKLTYSTGILDVGNSAHSGLSLNTTTFGAGGSNSQVTFLYNSASLFFASGAYGIAATGQPFSFATGASSIPDAALFRGGSNQIIYSGGGVVAIGMATSRAEINKAVTAFTDGVAKATFTVTIPNASHNATLEVEVTGICGAGGAIGAGECSATNSYKFNISRTAGVNAAVGVSAAYGAATSAVAGATTLTATAAASAVAGAVGAVNTFTVDVTITKGGGASDNHVALMYGKLMNANASGITIA